MINPAMKEERKARVLEAIAWFTESRGYPPTYRDLATEVGVAHSAVFYVVEALRTDGLIHERTTQHSRAITITPNGRAALNGRLTNPQ